jgi:hypothetical protein
MSHLREQISEVGYTIEPKCHNPYNALGPFFNKLPQELRDIIFADCLASGYPQFMATSRAMKEEGLGQIWEKGVFRMNINVVPGGPSCPRPTQEVLSKVQHLSVRIKATNRYLCSSVGFEIV